jgi:hypothetical protein
LVNTSLRTVKENFTRKFDRLNSDEDMFCLD